MPISIVIPTVPERKDQLQKLLSQLGDKFQVIVVDNPAWSLAEKRNYGLACSTNDLIYFIDDDNELLPNTIAELALMMESYSRCGIAASLAVNKDMVVDGGAFRSTLTGFIQGIYVNEYVSQVYPEPYDIDECANAFMVRRSVFQDIGGFDAQRFPMDMDEADLCLRARRKGWKVAMVPSSWVIHPMVPTIPKFRRKMNAYFMGRNRILFQRKHLNFLQFMCFSIVFVPVFVGVYTVCLAFNSQVHFIPTFLRGVWHGLRNKLDGAERYTETVRS